MELAYTNTRTILVLKHEMHFTFPKTRRHQKWKDDSLLQNPKPNSLLALQLQWVGLWEFRPPKFPTCKHHLIGSSQSTEAASQKEPIPDTFKLALRLPDFTRNT